MRTARRLSALLLLGASIVLTACADYQTAALKRDILPPEAIAARYSLDPAWWTGYRDKELDKLVSAALGRNVNLAQSAIAVNRALYQARLIGADLVPGFSADATASSDKNTQSGDASRNYKSQFAVSYEIDLWQRLRNAASAQEWEYKATQEDLEAARLALVNNVVDAYFDLRYLNQAIALTRANVERYTRLLSLTEDRYRFGKVAAVEPLLAEQALLSARNNLYDLETQQKTTEQTLRDLLDERPDTPLGVSGANLLEVAVLGVDLEVPVAALAARPDIRAAEARLQGAFKTVQADQASWFPSVTIGSTLSASSTRADRFFDVPFLGGTVQVSFPFLQWNTLRWQLKISEADFESARLGFTGAVTTALNEVDAAHYSWSKSLQILDNLIAKNSRDLAICAYYQNRYELGAGELKDYLDAQNTADSSMLSALSAKYQTIRLENMVYKAMGGRYTAR